jgi:hypothetical protein
MLANDALSYPFYNGDFYIFIENGGLKAITAVATIFGVYSWVTSPKT